MLSQPKSLWLTFWPMWLIANAIGFFIIIGGFAVPSVATGFSSGVLLAVLQWMVLRKYMGADYTWLAASIVVYGLFFPVTCWWLGSILLCVVACLLCLGVLGLLQRAVLTNIVDRPGLWVIASPFAGLLGLIIGITLVLATHWHSGTFWLVLGIAYGAITGAVLVWLNQTTKPYRDDPTPPWKQES